MNPFSVLDSDSDDDKPKPTATNAKENKATDNKKLKPANTTATGGGAKKAVAPALKKEQTGIAPGDAEVIATKEKIRDSGHGSKQKSENRSKKRAGGKNGNGGNQKNNNRRSGDSDAQQKKVSKGGQGSRNWGSDEAEARAANKDGRIEDDADHNDGEERAARIERELEPEPEPEPEPITFTFEEYMAQKAGAKKNEDVFGAIKERAVDASVEGKRVDEKEIENYLVVGGLKENKELKSKKDKSKKILQIDILGSEPEQQSNKDRDNKSKNPKTDSGVGVKDHHKTHRGHRGGVPSHHANKGKRANFDVSDQSAFPTLG